MCLHESQWHESERVSTDRYFVIDKETETTTEYVNTLKAYSDEEYDDILKRAGFSNVSRHVSLTGVHEPDQAGLFVLVGEV